MPSTAYAPHTRWISREDANSMVDAHSRKVVGVGTEEFIKNWKAGKYRNMDADECPGIVELAMLAGVPKSSRGRKNTKRSRR